MSNKIFKSKEAKILAEFELDSNYHSECSRHRRDTFIKKEYDNSYRKERSFKNLFHKPSFQLISDIVFALLVLLLFLALRIKNIKGIDIDGDIKDSVKKFDKNVQEFIPKNA